MRQSYFVDQAFDKAADLVGLVVRCGRLLVTLNSQLRPSFLRFSKRAKETTYNGLVDISHVQKAYEQLVRDLS